MSTNSSTNFGLLGEVIVKEYLGEQGFFVIDSNYHSPFGEIDIVALKKKRLYFVEVKTRTSANAGMPEDFVSKSKLEKIRKTTAYYLGSNAKYRNYEKEILVAAVLFNKDGYADITLHPVE